MCDVVCNQFLSEVEMNTNTSTYGNYHKSLQLCFMLVQVQHTSNHVKTAFMNASMLTQVYFRDILVSIIMPLLNRKQAHVLTNRVPGFTSIVHFTFLLIRMRTASLT